MFQVGAGNIADAVLLALSEHPETGRNVDASHIFGMEIFNGIDGNGEFTRNSDLSICTAPSIAKQGKGVGPHRQQ